MESQAKNIKKWWAPVWKGLVFDVEAKHCRRMKNAVWLFLYFLLAADRQTGILKRKLKTIESDMGVARATICRWLDVLRRTGYVDTRNSGHCLTVQVQRWKPLAGVPNLEHQKSQICDSRYPKSETPENGAGLKIPDYFGSQKAILGGANKSKLNILLRNERRNGGGHSRAGHSSTGKGFSRIGDCADRERLAWEIAKALGDRPGIDTYRAYARRLPERLIRKALAETLKDIPSQVANPKGRCALFHSLLQKHGSGTFENSQR